MPRMSGRNPESQPQSPGAQGGGGGSDTGEAMVVLEGMTRRYGDLVAVDGISLEVRRGEMFGLIGSDGAGKTTTLRVVLGLLGPDG